MPRNENRAQLALALVVGLLLLANLFTLTLVALSPAQRASRAPVLLAVFFVTLVVSVPGVLLIPRWLLKPYRRLVDEAERAPIAREGRRNRQHTGDEAEFVLETFQEVVAQLRAQQRELERLSASASARADTAERFSERIVASVPSGLVAFDAAGAATVVNQPARELLGVEAEVAEGRHLSELLSSAPELARMVGACLATGELFRREEVPARGADGREGGRRLGVTIAPIGHAKAGRGALCLLTDITEVVRLREEVALKRNLESLGEMSAGLAHEFKNALATLHGGAQLLHSTASGESARACADAMLREVRGLSEMVTSFLNFARPQPLHSERASLREMVESCAAELQAFYAERRIELLVEGDFPDAHVDERMLRQALLNLMRNAAEAFTDEQTAARHVRVRGRREGAGGRAPLAVIEVSDDGPGIRAEEMPKLFIPFFSTKPSGHGVGLALAHRVVTQHGGSLTATNADSGSGAVFTLRIPLD